MATTSQGNTLDKRETVSLIGSDKVEGTPVYRSNGDRVGQIERVMIDKLSGKVAYAVMSFGGFLGLGEDHYPVPWSLLTYNRELGGYDVDLSDEQLFARVARVAMIAGIFPTATSSPLPAPQAAPTASAMRTITGIGVPGWWASVSEEM